MLILIVFILPTFVVSQFHCIRPWNPGEYADEKTISGFYGQLENDESYDPRVVRPFSDCMLFYRTVGHSSHACGDCWAQVAVTHLGVWLCAIGKRPDHVLSSYDAVTCLKDASDGCELGGDYRSIEIVIFNGIATGTNAPDERGGCISYRWKMCRRGIIPDFSCPNWRRKYKRKRYNAKDAGCNDKCDDQSKKIVHFDKSGLMEVNGVEDMVSVMKHALVKRGSLISAYWAGKELSTFGRDEKMKNSIFDQEEPDFKGKCNHYLIIVAYGFDIVDGVKKYYWLTKNAYGMDFGNHGLLKIALGKNLNNIEEEVLFIRSSDRCAAPLPITIKRMLEINGEVRECYSEGGTRCLSGCAPFTYRNELLEFTCQDKLSGTKWSTAVKIKVTVQCEEIVML